MVGSFLIGFVALSGAENIQIEGVWFGLLTGFIQAAVVHYLIAKVFGPVLFGRLWCGWAPWTVMVLDLLPTTQLPSPAPCPTSRPYTASWRKSAIWVCRCCRWRASSRRYGAASSWSG
jgi:hypothetical protein